MTKGNQNIFGRIFMLVLVALVALPLTAFAPGRGHGKPTDVFVNGHDARDGRWDKNNRRDDNDDWQRRNRNDDWRRRNGGYGGYGNQQLRQTALNAGYNAGIREGRNDYRRGDRFDYRDEGAFRDATRDYNSRLGDRELYRQYFRQGFENGYRDGYRGY